VGDTDLSLPFRRVSSNEPFFSIACSLRTLTCERSWSGLDHPMANGGAFLTEGSPAHQAYQETTQSACRILPHMSDESNCGRFQATSAGCSIAVPQSEPGDVSGFVSSLRKICVQFGRASVSRDNWSPAIEEGPLRLDCRKDRIKGDRAAIATTTLSPSDSQGAGA